MIEKFAAFQEMAKEVLKPKESTDVPVFASKLNPSFILNLEQADKPLAEQFISRNADLKDKPHSETGVMFRENTVLLPNGEV